jgi:hypothetical protein
MHVMGVCLMSVHLRGVCLRRVPHRRAPHCVYLTDVYVMGMHVIGMHLIGVYLMGVHFMGVHHRMQLFLLSRTYVFAAFGGRWPDVAFLFLALSGQLGTCVPITPGKLPVSFLLFGL